MSKKSKILREIKKASIVIGAFLIVFVLISFFAFKANTESKIYNHQLMEIPRGFPVPSIPSDNYPNKDRIALGKRLFFDTITSRNNQLGCFSCHVAQKAMADTGRVSVGIEGKKGFRNTPTLGNIAYQDRFMKDGGVPTLEMQLLAPISDTVELDFNIVLVGRRMEKDSNYVHAAFKTYQKNASYYAFTISRAISCFQRTLITGNSSFDRFYHQNIQNAITPSQKRGFKLFTSNRLKCTKCHSGFNFTDNTFQNNGLYTLYGYDKGRSRVTRNKSDEGKFKVPTLRNIEFTAPYMHDGSLKTLEEVVEHYAKGGGKHPNKSGFINGFQLSSSEKADLINFLKSLSDTNFIKSPYQ